MPRLLGILYLSIALFTILPAQGFPTNSPAVRKNIENVPDRSRILSVFKKAIDLNEDFKSTVHTIPINEHQKKRIELKKFNEEVLAARIEDCAKLLSVGRDAQLAVEFFKLLISYENSADERLSYALGKVFLNNPDLVTETFDKFKRSDQQYLYKTLDWGWRNVTNGKVLPVPALQDRIKRLEYLRSRVSENEKEPFWEKGWYYRLSLLISVVAILISILYPYFQRRRQRRSLIIAFAYELVFAFHRCIIYYRQNLAGELSYSKLFDFTDASTLSTFATAG